MNAPKRRRLIAVAALLLIALALLALLYPSHPTEFVPLPNPNGYSQLTEAGQKLAQLGWSGSDEKRTGEIDVSPPVRETLQLARQGLARPSAVPTEFTLQYVDRHLKDLGSIKALSRGFISEGHALLRQGQTNEALQSFLDCLRLSAALTTNAVLIDRLVGLACETRGAEELGKLRNQLDRQQTHAVAQDLSRWDAVLSDIDGPLARERAFGERLAVSTPSPFLYRAMIRIQRMLPNSALKKMEQSFRLKMQKAIGQRRQLSLQCAVQAWTLDRGSPPERLGDLVPDYLPRLPVDPTTGQPLSLASSLR